MSSVDFTNVEKSFLNGNRIVNLKANIPHLVVDNFPLLGFLAALRFLEWVSDNPDGVISLPTGKTSEYFILWTVYLLKHWASAKGKNIREKYGLGDVKKPLLEKIRFVQIDEFYPISTPQHNSPRIRTTHDLLFFKEMKVDEIISHARKLEESMEGFMKLG